MTRIATPATVAEAPAASQPLLQAVDRQLGAVPNLFRMVGNSPAALEGCLSLMGALGRGELSVQMRERIALAVAEVNGCDYCLSAHIYFARNVANLDDAEITANRNGGSNDLKAAAAVLFAKKVAAARGRVSDADLSAVKAAGYSEAAVIEIVLNVAFNIWTNYVNAVAGTVIDFPVVHTRKA
ncbi:carboxymuconolactone decarboxylase family protein [Paraburkholderia fungorum]|uniref:carboxymuconolactone decarboxylase family protein n=1 Tax=Paraburkholderia fungorum TaxID=134537 RepID=UPI0038BC10E8